MKEPVFRVFVSSTFSDLREERNALQEGTFQNLTRFCASRGARFQAIDLRWGVSEEAGKDQQTMVICLNEIRRCQESTPRPNFVILLGERYGWCPLPPGIPAPDFKELQAMVDNAGDQELLRQWCRLDSNALALGGDYLLTPRTLDPAAWREVEKRLRRVFHQAMADTQWSTEDPRRDKYEQSATHQEIKAGAMNQNAAKSRVFACFRKVEGLPRNERANDYVDLQDGQPDLFEERSGFPIKQTI